MSGTRIPPGLEATGDEELDTHDGASRTAIHRRSGPVLGAIRIDVVEGPDKGRFFLAKDDTISVGTSKDNDFVLTDETVSGYHLELKHLGDKVLIRDLGSTNGTIAGRVAIERATSTPGVALRLGKTIVRVDDAGPLDVEILEQEDFHGIRGRSEGMRVLMAKIRRASRTDVSVLLLGETGSGKEVIASAIHRASARASKPIEIVDCGALAPTLIASELFGHEKGAFTGADRKHVGAFERANGGTLFLDEIGELPQTLQQTLLGALERRSFRRVGGTTPISVDVRLVCATNRDLRAEVNAGAFREDLYYRIAVVRLEIPSLRERIEDIPLLVEHFLRQAGYDEPLDELVPPDVMAQMREYRWPGNVRELRNFVEAALAMGEAPGLDRERADSPVAAAPAPSGFPSVPIETLLKQKYKEARTLVSNEFEALYLAKLVERAGGNVSKAARDADIHRTYLIEMLKRHGIK
ncbi:MAG: sigma 54-dependent Fis family transcriptional regulator [Deltaproteobacteria bacterium]|nr:sigma 54-dependent Fis family transcriptional regulator [Deltaproteobacteria bacterium]